MSQWLQQVIDRGSKTNDWLSPVRQQALNALRQTRWPTRRTEAWRYTSLSCLDQLELSPESGNAPFNLAPIAGLETIDLVFVDGQLQTDLTALNLPQGVSIYSAQSLPADQQAAAVSRFSQVKPSRHLFGMVNDVLADNVLFIDVDPECHCTTPLRIVHHNHHGYEAHYRVQVNLGHHGKLTLIEHAQGSGDNLRTGFTECLLDTHAELEHYQFLINSPQALYFGGTHFSLNDHAQLNSTVIGFGSQLSRLDVDIIHSGEHAQAKMNAVYLLGESEHFDLHSTIEHAKPNGTSEENVRGIVGDKATAVFNGRIHIHRDAQKTLAELNNRNLLLSRRGQINTKPELEIYADDVKCAHGATVAEIEEEALYYLMSRGIGRSQALVMLNVGFIQELINQMPNQALAEWLAPILSARFKEMEVR
ncbi:Fe-S cluster assembly protein SufD [Vibrio metschnikovii]|uniref:Fe-S cluster assembly protein SufD n=1 Tax=Vibrio metschnikovii TaxID=28172 RepID=UPI001C304F9E|nr:Fe-S cluster assembly protein SufD [Vibrio metschnikovii]